MRGVRGRASSGFAGFLMLISAASALASPVYDAETTTSESGCTYPGRNQQDGQSVAGAPASSYLIASGVGRACEVYASGTAVAGASGRLSAWSSVLATIGSTPPYFSEHGSATAYASVEFDDLVFRSSDPNATQVAPVLRLSISGGLSASRGGQASVTVSAAGVVSGSGEEDLLGSTSTTCTGLFAGCPDFGTALLMTGAPVLLGVPYPLRLRLGTSTDAGAGNFPPAGGSNSDAYANFAHTLEFPASGPVFDLPQGFTVDSVEAGIADNRWLGASVPEPATASLIALGLAGLAARTRSLAAGSSRGRTTRTAVR